MPHSRDLEEAVRVSVLSRRRPAPDDGMDTFRRVSLELWLITHSSIRDMKMNWTVVPCTLTLSESRFDLETQLPPLQKRSLPIQTQK